MDTPIASNIAGYPFMKVSPYNPHAVNMAIPIGLCNRYKEKDMSPSLTNTFGINFEIVGSESNSDNMKIANSNELFISNSRMYPYFTPVTIRDNVTADKETYNH